MMRIGMSYSGNGDSYGYYPEGLRNAAAACGYAIEPVWMAKSGTRYVDPASIHGIVFTGGPDVHPSRYGKPDAASQCEGIDAKRDAIEVELLEAVLRLNVPIMGICRGMQFLNVHFGGSLIPHIESHRQEAEGDAEHEVDLLAGSILAESAGQLRSTTNSSHHQAVERLAPTLRLTATAADGTIEGFEWRDPSCKPELLAVQWHPERMDPTALLGGRLLQRFLQTCQSGQAARSV